jgi:CrcB protein
MGRVALGGRGPAPAAAQRTLHRVPQRDHPRTRTVRRRPSLPPARSLLLVAAGGALGAVLRVAIGALIAVTDGGLPWNTLVVNLSGACLLGVLLGLVTARLGGGTWVRPALGTGVLGAYTTFSTVSVEIEQLAAGSAMAIAVAYALVTLIGGLLAAWTGSVLAALVPSVGLPRQRR